MPVDLQEALLLCQRTKELILGTYKQQLDNYLQGKTQDVKVTKHAAPVSQTFLEMYHSEAERAEDKEL